MRVFLEVTLTVVAIFIGFVAVAAFVRFAPFPEGRSFDRVVVPVVAVVAAALAFPAHTHLTGWTPFDAVIRAGFAALVVLAAARRGPWAVAWSAAVLSVVLVVASSPCAWAATAALGGIAALIAADVRDPVVQAFAGFAVAEVALRLDWRVGLGASAFAVVIATVPLLVAGAATLERRGRRIVVFGIAAFALFAVVAGGLGGLAALRAKASVDRGVRAARDGLAALSRDDRDEARRDFDAARAAFAEGDSKLRTFWARPAYAVPFAAQQLRAVDTLAGSGGDLAQSASTALTVADPRSIRPIGGQVDLDAIRRVQGPLDDVRAVLRRSHQELEAVDSPWLVKPVADRFDELTGRVDHALQQADVAARAAQLAPALLGGSGVRHYLLAVYTPSESRPGGGFMGNYGELTADNGKVTLSRFGREKELEEGGLPGAQRTITDEPTYLQNWGSYHPEQFWGVINVTNDFPTVADVMRQLYPQSGGEPVDGVIAVDPDAFAALVRLTGPLTVPGWPEPVTADNARQILLHDQYAAFGSDTRVDFLGDATHLLFDTLTSGSLPGVGTAANVLGPVVEGRHLQLESVHPDEQALFDLMGATGAVPPLRGDSVGFTGQNYNGNKIDWFLHRDATYDVRWDPATGVVNSTLTITLRNDAPSTGEPHAVIGWGGDAVLNQAPVADGENLMLLTVYSALRPTGFTVDGQTTGGSSIKEYDRYATRFYVRIPSMSTSTVRFEFSGRVPQGHEYTFDPVRQPMANPDGFTLRLGVPSSWTISSSSDVRKDAPDAVTAQWRLDEGHEATVVACRSSGFFDRLKGC